MSIEEYRSNRNISKKDKIKKYISNLISRVLITIIIFLIGLIVTNKNAYLKEKINNIIYNDTFKFSKVQNLYNKYFGKYIGISNNTNTSSDTKKVFDEKIAYTKSSNYKDGVELTVDNNYLVPTLDSGIVIYIGEKEGYGNTIIIEQIDGVNVWYSNINTSDIKMYDYIEKGSIIGEAKDKKIYLLFEKDGKFLNYKEYI